MTQTKQDASLPTSTVDTVAKELKEIIEACNDVPNNITRIKCEQRINRVKIK
jgi:hypothetical protein